MCPQTKLLWFSLPLAFPSSFAALHRWKEQLEPINEVCDIAFSPSIINSDLRDSFTWYHILQRFMVAQRPLSKILNSISQWNSTEKCMLWEYSALLDMKDCLVQAVFWCLVHTYLSGCLVIPVIFHSHSPIRRVKLVATGVCQPISDHTSPLRSPLSERLSPLLPPLCPPSIAIHYLSANSISCCYFHQGAGVF